MKLNFDKTHITFAPAQPVRRVFDKNLKTGNIARLAMPL